MSIPPHFFSPRHAKWYQPSSAGTIDLLRPQMPGKPICSDIPTQLLPTQDFTLFSQQPRILTPNSFQDAIFSLNLFISLKILIIFLEMLLMSFLSNALKSSKGQLHIQLG